MNKLIITCAGFLLLASACNSSISNPRISNDITPAAVNRDISRKQDIADIQTALVLFKNDSGAFPASLSSLSQYLVVPTAPTPPDGPCTAQDNNYTYTVLSVSSYRLKFCLGSVGRRTVTEKALVNATDPDRYLPQ